MVLNGVQRSVPSWLVMSPEHRFASWSSALIQVSLPLLQEAYNVVPFMRISLQVERYDPGGIRNRAVALGEHTDEVLSEIRYSDEEITALRKAEVV
jgi:crotonobetainyl-CoA:carnitine CoA-transferase CaiB-like acyl-CoA transferase